MAVCQRCGAQVQEKAVSCQACDASLGGSAQPMVTGAVKAAPAKIKRQSAAGEAPDSGFSGFSFLARSIRVAFLLRIPLLTLLILTALGPLSLTVAEKPLGNLLDQEVFVRVAGKDWQPSSGWTNWSLFSVSFSAFLLSFTAIAVVNLVFEYGKERLDDPAIEFHRKRPLLVFILGSLSAATLCACVSYRTDGPSLAAKILLPFLSLVLAFLLAVVAKIAQLALTDPSKTPHPPPYLIFPVYLIPKLEKWFDALYCWHSGSADKLKGRFRTITQWPLEIFRQAGQGYLIDVNAPAGELRLQSGHVFTLALGTLSFLAYLVIGYFKSRINDQPAAVPALAFVLLWMIVSCWVLSGLAFFLDRYRFPLLAGIVLLSVGTSFAPVSDHFFRVGERDTSGLLSPAQVLATRKQPHNRLVLVATAGGGIQAAAWTAKVLTGLEAYCAQRKPACDFHDAVALISSVSGGSLGAMAYANSYASQSHVSVEQVLGNAEAAALDEVAWGWTNPDASRTILPWFRSHTVDRGWALEEKWSAINQIDHNTFLTDWAREVRNGMPALLLNSTVVETGRPVAFSTTSYPHNQDSREIRNFYDFYADPRIANNEEEARKRSYDLRVTTAVRLSASFPYVAPAARPDARFPAATDYHFVDGGYYDNFGVTALLGWLEDAIATNDPAANVALQDVLVLQIRSFPSGEEAPRTKHGWGFQLIAPIDGLMAVRDSGQAAHDASELQLFAKYYDSRKVRLWKAVFEFPDFSNSQIREEQQCNREPLSWKLNQTQMNCIETGWNGLLAVRPELIECIGSYLSGDELDPKKNPPCAEASAAW